MTEGRTWPIYFGRDPERDRSREPHLQARNPLEMQRRNLLRKQGGKLIGEALTHGGLLGRGWRGR